MKGREKFSERISDLVEYVVLIYIPFITKDECLAYLHNPSCGDCGRSILGECLYSVSK